MWCGSCPDLASLTTCGRETLSRSAASWEEITAPARSVPVFSPRTVTDSPYSKAAATSRITVSSTPLRTVVFPVPAEMVISVAPVMTSSRSRTRSRSMVPIVTSRPVTGTFCIRSLPTGLLSPGTCSMRTWSMRTGPVLCLLVGLAVTFRSLPTLVFLRLLPLVVFGIFPVPALADGCSVPLLVDLPVAWPVLLPTLARPVVAPILACPVLFFAATCPAPLARPVVVPTGAPPLYPKQPKRDRHKWWRSIGLLGVKVRRQVRDHRAHGLSLARPIPHQVVQRSDYD